MHSPKITIGITCFNAESTIQYALASALEQDWPNTEIIIVDDASTINPIIGMSVDSRMNIVRHDQNRGVSVQVWIMKKN